MGFSSRISDMLYVLDESFLAQDFTQLQAHSGVELLLYAVAQGKHIVAASPGVVSHLLAFQFSAMPRAPRS